MCESGFETILNYYDSICRGYSLMPAFFKYNFMQSKNILFSSIIGTSAMTLFSYCLLYTSPSPRDRTRSRMPSSA